MYPYNFSTVVLYKYLYVGFMVYNHLYNTKLVHYYLLYHFLNYYLTVFGGHGMEPREAKIGGVLVTLGDAVHQIQQHLGVFLELLHLHCVRQDHVEVEHQVLNLPQNININNLLAKKSSLHKTNQQQYSQLINKC